MSATPHTIYDELRKLAIKMGATSEQLSKTHNIKDILRVMNVLVETDSNAQHIADGVKKYTDKYPDSTEDGGEG